MATLLFPVINNKEVRDCYYHSYSERGETNVTILCCHCNDNDAIVTIFEIKES